MSNMESLTVQLGMDHGELSVDPTSSSLLRSYVPRLWTFLGPVLRVPPKGPKQTVLIKREDPETPGTTLSVEVSIDFTEVPERRSEN